MILKGAIDRMKKGIAVMVIPFLTILFVGSAQGELYLEGYMGDNFAVSSPHPLEIKANPLYSSAKIVSTNYPQNVSFSLLGGVKLGTWFVREGFLGFDYPSWMKYLGFYLDFCFHSISFQKVIGSQRMYFFPSPSPNHFELVKFTGDGEIVTLAFMAAFRYGFSPSEEVPFGRWQPYVAIGPAIFFSGLSPQLLFQGGPNVFFPGSFGYINMTSDDSSVNVGLATEAGLRRMFTKHLSLEISVKYRYVHPSYSYNFSYVGYYHQLRVNPTFHLFNFQIGAAYHF
jgi:hypothetical protein